MKHSFLICGYPRTRTMWFSHFLSVPRHSVCTHEATEFAGSPEEFWCNARAYASEVETYGNSDSANIFVLPALLAERPMTKVVWIDRPVLEVEASMREARVPHTSDSMKTLLKFRNHYAQYFDLVLNFKDLVTAEACRRIWELCLPDIEFDYGRWGIFTERKICYSKSNPFPVKQYAKFLEWVGKEIDEETAQLWKHGGETSL